MVKFELNTDGVRELLQSKEMSDVLAQRATQILGRLSKGYGMSRGMTEQRAKATVGTRSISSQIDNLKNNSLLKALGGGND